MHQTSDHDKDMKNGVHIFFLFSDTVKHGADGVAYAAQNKEENTACADFRRNDAQHRGDTPADGDVQYHSENLVFVEINGGKGYAESRKPPHRTEICPAESGAVLTERAESKRCVCSCYQEKDGAVVENSEHLLCFQRRT